MWRAGHVVCHASPKPHGDHHAELLDGPHPSELLDGPLQVRCSWCLQEMRPCAILVLQPLSADHSSLGPPEGMSQRCVRRPIGQGRPSLSPPETLIDQSAPTPFLVCFPALRSDSPTLIAAWFLRGKSILRLSTHPQMCIDTSLAHCFNIASSSRRHRIRSGILAATILCLLPISASPHLHPVPLHACTSSA